MPPGTDTLKPLWDGWMNGGFFVLHRWAMLCDLFWRPAVGTLSESEECQSYFPKQGDLNQSAWGAQWELCE